MKNAARIIFAALALYIALSLILSACISLGLARWEIISHRAPFLLVDIAVSEVTTPRPDGLHDGHDQHGEYIAFEGLETGDKVLSLMIFNPFTNWPDDISARYDLAVWH